VTDDELRAALADALWTPISEASWATGVAMLDSDVAAFRDRIADALLPVVRAHPRTYAADVLRAAAAEQRTEADNVPWDDQGTHADGHRCAAEWLDRRAAALRDQP
jgi:hypothetical protein